MEDSYTQCSGSHRRNFITSQQFCSEAVQILLYKYCSRKMSCTIVCSTIDIASATCCGMPLNKSWHDYNESLIERGRVLIDVSLLKSSNKEIKMMNIGKIGAPFQYSDSYVRFLAFLKIGFKIPYRMVQGIVCGLAEYVKIVEEIHFTHIRKRMIGIKPSIENDNDNDNDEPLVVDASGLTVSKKGDYIEALPDL